MPGSLAIYGPSAGPFLVYCRAVEGPWTGPLAALLDLVLLGLLPGPLDCIGLVPTGRHQRSIGPHARPYWVLDLNPVSSWACELSPLWAFRWAICGALNRCQWAFDRTVQALLTWWCWAITGPSDLVLDFGLVPSGPHHWPLLDLVPGPFGL